MYRFEYVLLALGNKCLVCLKTLCKLHVTAIPMVNIDHCGKYKTSVSDV